MKKGAEVEKAQLEARLMAQRIKAMVDSGYEVYDRKTDNVCALYNTATSLLFTSLYAVKRRKLWKS